MFGFRNLNMTPPLASVDFADGSAANPKRTGNRRLRLPSFDTASDLADIIFRERTVWMLLATVVCFILKSVRLIASVCFPRKMLWVTAEAIVTNDRSVGGLHVFGVFTSDEHENCAMSGHGSAVPANTTIATTCESVRPQQAFVARVFRSLADKVLGFLSKRWAASRVAMHSEPIVMCRTQSLDSAFSPMGVAIAFVERTFNIFVSHFDTPLSIDLDRKPFALVLRMAFAL